MSTGAGAELTGRVEQVIREEGISTVRLGGVDVDGIWRGKSLSADFFLRSACSTGVRLCGGVLGVDHADELVPGLDYTGWPGGYGDVALVPDLATFTRLPWAPGTAAVLGDFVSPLDGAPVPISPRAVLRRVLERCREHGFDVRVGHELEFHLFRETPAAAEDRSYGGLTPVLPGVRTYSLIRVARLGPFLGDLTRHLTTCGLPVESVSTEYSPGQLEVNLSCADPLTAADRTVLFKHAVREIAALHGLTATFMAKYDAALGGNSGHIHQSLWDPTGTNLFAPGPADGALSPLGRRYLAGQLATMAEFTALFCPTVNSYKRTTAWSFVPTTVTWGADNRTTALRVVGGSPAATRVEHRLPGADANPYLAIAASLAGGLHGIEHDLAPPSAVPGNAYELGPDEAVALPGSLDDAVRALDAGKVARDLLGSEFVEHFLTTRRFELAASRAAVTDWERRRYFELA